MSFWTRLTRIIKANLNDIISKAEDPRKILEQVMLEMKEQYQEAREQVVLAVADEKRLEKKKQAEEESIASWEHKAIRAVQLGDDDLAREALSKKAHHEQLYREYHKQWQAQQQSVEQLKKALTLLQDKMEEAERQKEILLARERRARAQQSIQSTVSKVLDHSAMGTLSKMSQKIEELEAQAEAEMEMNQELVSADLEEKFRELEDRYRSQDDALAALKARLGVKENEKEHSFVVEKQREVVPVERDEEW
jgi:phage shock protein A